MSDRSKRQASRTKKYSGQVSQPTKQVTTRGTPFVKRTASTTQSTTSSTGSKPKHRNTYQNSQFVSKPKKNSQQWKPKDVSVADDLQATIARLQKRSILTPKDRRLLRTLGVPLSGTLESSVSNLPSSVPLKSIKDQGVTSVSAMSSSCIPSSSVSPLVSPPVASSVPIMDSCDSSSLSIKKATVPLPSSAKSFKIQLLQQAP